MQRAGLAIVLLGIGAGRAAHAEEARLDLTYRAPEGCPSADDLRRAVERLATPENTPYAASVEINQGEQFSALIEAPDGSERRLFGNSCQELVEATAVVLALAMSPGNAASTEAGGTSPAARAASSSGAGARPASGAAGAHSSGARSRDAPRTAKSKPAFANTKSALHVVLGAGSALDVGTMPHADLGAAAAVGVAARRWSVSLEGSYWLLRESRRFEQRPNVGGDFTWWSAAALGCLAPLPSSSAFELCAGPELGRITGHGVGVGAQEDVSALRFGFEGLAQLRLPLGPAVRVRAGAGAATVVYGQHEFVIGGIGPVFRPSVVAGRMLLEAELAF